MPVASEVYLECSAAGQLPLNTGFLLLANRHFAETEMTVKVLTGIQVGNYRLESAVQNG